VTATDLRWPDAVQGLALTAAIAPPDVALAAWKDLVDRVDLTDLWDDEVYGLLPTVWCNLGTEVGAEHHDLLKGLYRRAWVHNQHQTRHAAALSGDLGRAGIGNLLLGGVPIGLRHHDDLGARPMGPVDVLVRADDGAAARRVVESAGYEAVPVRAPAPSRWERTAKGADGVERAGRPGTYRRGPLDRVVLHTTIGPDAGTDPVDALWAAAVAFDLDGVAVRTLSPAHQLCHTVLHGVDSFDGPKLRWIPDSLAIVRDAGADLDWDAFAEAVEAHRCQLFVREGLDHLVERWGLVVPAAVRARLRDGEVDRRQRAGHAVQRRAGWRFPRAARGISLYLTRTRGLGPAATIAHLPTFLEGHWQVDRRHLPLVTVHKLGQGGRRVARMALGKARARLGRSVPAPAHR
jgi:hypothetical protein